MEPNIAGLNAIIVEDQPDAAAVLSSLLAELAPGISVLGVIDNIPEAITFIENNPPDLLFLDVDLPPHSGFELLESLGDKAAKFHTIFVTAYDHYAIQAIKYSAFDYLLKPVATGDLAKTLKKIDKDRMQEPDPMAQMKKQLDGLLQKLDERKYRFNTRSGFYIVYEDDILFVEADGSYSKLQKADGEQIYLSTNLKECQNMLDEGVFARISRGYLVNTKYVIEVNRKKKQLRLSTRGGREYLLKITQGFSGFS